MFFSNPDPYRIQIQMGQWNRFRIENPDPNSGKPKFSHEKEKMKKFHVCCWAGGRHLLEPECPLVGIY